MALRSLRRGLRRLLDGSRKPNPSIPFRRAVLSLEQLEDRDVPAAPVISAIGEQFVDENHSLRVNFTASEQNVSADSLTLTATSSNASLIANANLFIDSSGANRTLTVVPTSNQIGNADITLTVTDPSGNATTRIIPVLVSDTKSVGFTDEFNVGNSSFLGVGWIENAGDFDAANDKGVAVGSGVNLATLNGLIAADVQVNTQFTISAAGQNVGLVARYNGAGDQNMYLGNLHFTGSGYQASIWRNFGGAWTQLYAANVPTSILSGAGTATLIFQVVGPSLKLFVNSTVVAFAGDSALSAPGSVGLRGTAGAVYDGKFSVSTLIQFPASLPFDDDFSHAGEELNFTWLNRVGNFQEVAGAATAAGSLNLATVNGISSQRVALVATLTLGVGEIAGLVTSYSGPGDKNMYFGGLQNLGGGTLQASIWRNLNGVWTQLAVQNLSGTGDGTLRFEQVDRSLRLFRNDTLIAFATDSVLLNGGGIGMLATAGADFHNFSATSVTLNNVSLPFNDTFTSAVRQQLNENWFNQVGNYQVVSGSAKGLGNVNLATVNSVSLFVNVAVQADVSLSAGQFAGLVARYGGTGDQNMYLGTLQKIGSSLQASIWRNVNGVWTQLTVQTISENLPGTLRFEVFNSSLKLFYNNTLVAFANDSTFTFGLFGMRSTAGARFDSFSTSDFGTTSPTLPFSDAFTSSTSQQLSIDWTNEVGIFQVSGGAAHGIGSLNLARINVISVNTFVQADVTLTTGQVAGLVTGYSGLGDQNMYLGAVQQLSSGYQASIWRNVNGAWTQLFVQNFTGSANGTLRFESVAGSLKLFLNGSLMAFANDTTFTVGLMGMRATAGVQFDNVSAANIALTNNSVPFSDAFGSATNAQLSNSWLNRAGNYKVTNGVARGNGSLNLATVNGVSAANVTVQANVNVAGGQIAGLVARYSGVGDQNMYLATAINLGSSVELSIWVNVNGNWTKLAATTTSATTGILKFALAGTSLKLFFDNLSTPLLDITDSTITTAGLVGMRSTFGAEFDNFSVT